MDTHQEPLSKAEVEAVLGRVTDEMAVAILESGATLEDLEVAAQWASGSNDLMGKTGHPLVGAAAAVYEILIADQTTDENER